MARVVPVADLPGSAVSSRFEGAEHGAEVSFFVTEFPPGQGPRLHRHPYEETFIVETGRAAFTAGEEQLEVAAGEVLVVPARTPHKFATLGDEPSRVVSIHPVARMEQEWLE